MKHDTFSQHGRSKGALAEDLAGILVQQQHHKIIVFNYHCRFGEIDLICQYNNTLVFIEVRHRSSSNWGGALQSVTYAKQQKIIKTAAYFLSKNIQFSHYDCRFDVISFQGKIELKNALWTKRAFI